MSTATAPLALRGIGKQFAGIWVAQDIDLDIRAGELLALVGENGAGKSTLVKAIAGVHQPDAGSLLLDGSAVRFGGPMDAQRAGIEVIHQHPNLFADLTVAENVTLSQPPRTRIGTLDRAEMVHIAERVLSRLGVDISANRPVGGLSLADQQLIEIAKSLVHDVRVLVLDEPTAALSSHEVERLFEILRDLRASGVAMMLVNHRLDEVYAICDRITIIRDGRHIVTAPVSDLTTEQTVKAMVGRDVSMVFPERGGGTVGEVALEVDRLTRRGVFDDVSFTVRKGEIVGMAGLVGAGRTEIARAIFGADPFDSGQITVGGVRARIVSPAHAVQLGIAYVPEDRHRSGVALELSVRANLVLPRLRSLSRLLFVNRLAERVLALEFIDRLRIKTAGDETPVARLSGGNQQKVVISRWLAMDPRIFILDEPTQGVDIGAKGEVHEIISSLAEQGRAIVLISSDLPELLGLSDRVLVVRDGKIVAEFSREEARPDRVLAAAVGEVVPK